MESVGIEKLHVLAVDDSLVDRKMIERLLKISSCKVTVVESGIRALEFLGLGHDDEKKMEFELQELKVNLIITDYSMPGMTGFELLKKIKGSSAWKKIPVVIMSSENIITRINRCLEEGAEDFLMKPVKLSDVEKLTDFLIKEVDNTKVCEMRTHQITSTASFAASVDCPRTGCVALKTTLPSLFTSSELLCSLQHLSSPPSSPHWHCSMGEK